MAKYLIVREQEGKVAAWRDKKFRYGTDTSSWTEEEREAVQFHYSWDAEKICDKFDNCKVITTHEFNKQKEENGQLYSN